MMACRILGAGIVAPGLPDWQAARGILSGRAAYVGGESPRPNPMRLPPNERRRASASTRLALAVADEAVRTAGIDPAHTASVFASASGDLHLMHAVCEALSVPEPTLSPTVFHNSVHNAPAGYWSIATGARAPYTAISAQTFSFAAGLTEALAQLHCEGGPVLLVAYEVPPPFPLDACVAMRQPFACALVLAADDSDAVGLARLRLTGTRSDAVDARPFADPGLDALHRDNPAAAALPLLSLLATGLAGQTSLPMTAESHLQVSLQPC